MTRRGAREAAGRQQVRDTAGIYALFAEGDDFVTDLGEDKDLVERRIVRIGSAVGASGDGTSMELVIEAQAIVAGRLVMLRQHYGPRGGAAILEEADRRAHEDLVWLRGELEHLGLDVRSGSWRLV